MELSPREGVLIGGVLVLASVLIGSRLQTRSSEVRPYAYLYRMVKRRLIKCDISKQIFRIGRHPNNELRLKDRSVSRFHAEIVHNIDGSFTVHDTQSKNGIRVGLRPVNSCVLKEGDLLDIGRVRFRFTRLPRDFFTFAHTERIEAGQTHREQRRRRIDRRALTLNVRLYHDGMGWVGARIRDLSPLGAFVEVQRQFRLRAPVEIVFPMAFGARQRWLRLPGEVVRENKKGVGVSFGELDDSTTKALQSLSQAA